MTFVSMSQFQVLIVFVALVGTFDEAFSVIVKLRALQRFVSSSTVHGGGLAAAAGQNSSP